MPPQLFRFFPFDTRVQKRRVRNVLLRRHLWSSRAGAINDPFECRPYMDFNATLEQKVVWLARQLVASGTCRQDIAESEARRKLQENRIAPDTEAMTSRILEKCKKIGVICFSATREPLLLWSHYAAGHRGLCVGFRQQEAGGLLSYAKEVKYQNEYPTVRAYLDDDPARFDKVVLTKSMCWAYEREWRVVSPEAADCSVIFEDRNLVSVTLGACMDPCSEELIVRWARREFPHVVVSRAKLEEKTFGLAFEAL